MPQATTKAPQANRTQAPTAPRAATPQAVQSAIAVPQTQRDLDNLLARRSELSEQFNSANSQRNELARQLRNSRVGPDQTGIEARITQLDARIISIESSMQDIGTAVAAAPIGLRQTTSTGVPAYGRFGQPNAGQITAVSIVGIVCVLMPLSFAFAKVLLRRAARPPAPQIPKDVSDRLERMEQGIESVAIEVERIGEGQRFVTQLMSDRAQRAALAEGVPRT